MLRSRIKDVAVITHLSPAQTVRPRKHLGARSAYSPYLYVSFLVIIVILGWKYSYDFSLVANITSHGRVAPVAFSGTVAYGTRGHGSGTATNVRNAILAGFRHVATAAFHKDNDETAAGEGWVAASNISKETAGAEPIDREDLYLQTMFVPWGTPNHAPPIQSDGWEGEPPSISDQVRQSVESSLKNLRTDRLDAVIYHNFRAKLQPYDEMIEAWRELENYVRRGIVRHLGISNIHDLDYLERLINDAEVKPSIVQNRFHKNRAFDVQMRPLLAQHDIKSQSFWVLTGNGSAIGKSAVQALAKELSVSPQMLMYDFLISLGSCPLIGTQSEEHMQDDIRVAAIHESGKKLFRDITGRDEDRRVMAKAIGIPYQCVHRPEDCRSSVD